MLGSKTLQHLEVEYALFNAKRTLSSHREAGLLRTSRHGVILLIDQSRPDVPYGNRILGLTEDSANRLDDLLGPYAMSGISPQLDVALAAMTERLACLLIDRGFRPGGSLFYLSGMPRDLTEPQSSISRWGEDQADAFFDLLESAGSPIPPAIRKAKRKYYCTDTFRSYVATVDGFPAAWATLYLHADGDHGYLANAFTHPKFRARGLQRDLLVRRILDAADLGLRSVVTDVEPGTTSERNCRRVGLQTEAAHVLWHDKKCP